MTEFKKISLIILLGFFSFSCGEKAPIMTEPQEDEIPAPVKPAIIEITELAPVETPEYKQAMITFISGNVFRLEDGEWVYAEIGEFLEEDDSILVESGSFCEIQFGDRAVIRVEEDTELALNTIDLKSGEATIGIELALGSVLCKVRKLADNDSFNVKTPSVACGVRGTEFSVNADSSGDTVLAVKEGAVAILPPELVVEELVDRAGESGNVVADILKKIETAAFVVGENEEINLTKKSFEKIDEIVQKITEIIELIEADEEGPEKEISVEIVKALTTASKIVTETVVAAVAPVKEISVENTVKLKSTEDMRMISIPVVTVPVTEDTDKAGESKAVEPAAQVSLHKFSLKIVPANAEIILNSKIVGKGSFSGIFEEGEILDFDFISENFESQKISFTVSGETSKQYTISLIKSGIEQEKKEEEKPEPQAGKGKTSAVKEVIEEEKVLEVKEEVKLFDVSVIIKPADSTLMVNGEKVVSGRFTGSFPDGAKLQVSGKRNGFADKSIMLNVGAQNAGSFTINLDPRPVEAVIPISGNRLVGSITAGANKFYTSDSRGTVSAVTVDGRIIWSVKTNNKSIENSYPVFMGNRIYFSGSSEFVIINAVNGKVIDRQSLDKNSAHIFGRRIVPMGSEGLFPSNEEIRIIDRSNGNTIRSIDLPGNGSRMTPTVWNNKILSVDQNGTLSIINSESGSVEKEISTGGSQPIALSVTVKNDLAVFSGRKGNVVCIDLNAGKVLWEKQLNESGTRVQVYSDIICSSTAAYIYTKGVIFGLNLKTGEDIFESIKNVSSPPALIDNELVFGNTDAKLIFMDAVSGNIKKTLILDNDVSTRPAELNGKVCVGINPGKMVIINPEGIR